jgi:hypothetical protein
MNEIRDQSLVKHPEGYAIQANTATGGYELSEFLSQYRMDTACKLGLLGVVDFYNVSSVSSSGYVMILPQYSFCPALIGSDNQPVFLFDFVEVIDELLDYDRIKEEIPNISYAQIDGAISFIRKLLQFNSKSLDIDDLREEMSSRNELFLDRLRSSLITSEPTIVLDFD